MIRATVKTFSFFPQYIEAVDRLAHDGVQHAAEVGAQVAQANASIDLELAILPARAAGSAYIAGIKAHKQTRTPGRTTPIAVFFDGGTLGGRHKALKRPRKSSWTEKKQATGSVYTAHRGDVSGKGIPAERFFGKARRAGRAALLEQIRREAAARLGRR